MNLEMEVLSPSSYLPKASWLSRSTKWTHEENKRFENALAIYDQDTPDRWHKVASLIPGKTVGDVVRQYNELVDDVSNIEAGLVPIPGYNTNDDINTSRFTLAWGNSHGNGFDGFNYKQNYGKRGLGGTRPSEQERKKGVPWTEDEHKLFLIGLKKYGKGDWRNISRNFVVTRTPTQVASHAQKYFIRQLSGGKDKRRASIHDITTVNLDNLETPSPDNNNNNNRSSSSPPDQSALQHVNNPTMTKSASFQWQQQNNGSNDGIGFNPNQSGNFFVSSPYGFNNAYAVKLQGQNLQQYINGSQSMGFQMQHYQHG